MWGPLGRPTHGPWWEGYHCAIRIQTPPGLCTPPRLFLRCPVGSSGTAHLTGSAFTQSKESQAARDQRGLIQPEGEGNLVELRAVPSSLSSRGEKLS